MSISAGAVRQARHQYHHLQQQQQQQQRQQQHDDNDQDIDDTSSSLLLAAAADHHHRGLAVLPSLDGVYLIRQAPPLGKTARSAGLSGAVDIAAKRIFAVNNPQSMNGASAKPTCAVRAIQNPAVVTFTTEVCLHGGERAPQSHCEAAMNMMSSAEADVAYFRTENLDPDVRRLIGLSKDFDCIGPLPALESITCTFRALLDWIGDDDPQQAFRLEMSLLSAGMTPQVMEDMTVTFTRCENPQPELRP